MSCPRCGEPVPNMSNNHKCKGPEKMNIAFNQSVSSQQARIKELTDETWKLGTARDEAEARIRELEAELEARKKAWEGLVEWVNTTWVQEGALGFKGALADKLTALEAILPKGGA